MTLLLHFLHRALMMADVMNDRRNANQVPLPLIVVFVLTLLAFLPLALPGRGGTVQPVHGYSTPGFHHGEVAPVPASEGNHQP